MVCTGSNLHGKAADHIVEGGAKQQQLCLGVLFSDVLNQPHAVIRKCLCLEHLIRLIEDQDLDGIQRKDALLSPALQPAVRAHHHLLRDARPASFGVACVRRCRCRSNARELGHAHHDPQVLYHQFARWTRAQRLRLIEARIHSAQHGQHEAGGLARAVVCLRYKVSVWRRQDHGQRGGLNARGALKLHLYIQALQEFRGEVELFKRCRRGVDVPLSCLRCDGGLWAFTQALSQAEGKVRLIHFLYLSRLLQVLC
mmetsp:Transcript_22750/g.62854  ORF Transcript_22750/g.62854 Transcript_22750/m.62854 type:complete len:255 (+) Transcript_22750:697-1461(+)